MDDRREDEQTRSRLDEIAEGYAATDATVLRLLDRQQWTIRLMVLLVVGGIVSSVYFYDQNGARANDNRALAQRATTLARQNAQALARADESIKTAQQAIVSGCDLLVSAVQQVGITPTRRGESKASRLNRVLTVTVIDEVLRRAPPSLRARVAGLYRRLLKAGPIISLPDCKSLAEASGKVP